MTEILTESFCERCGTRYTFETVQRRSSSLGRLGTIGRGLKHFVVMSDASLDEAMAVARSEDEAKVTTAQLEAFHRTFNFCLQCRQYTCADCWNAVEGRCLTCAPMPVEELPPPIEAMTAPVAPPPIVVEPAPTIEILPTPGPAALPPEPEAEPEPEAAAVAEPEAAELEPELVAVLEPEVAPAPDVQPEPLPEPEAEPEPVAAEATMAAEAVFEAEPEAEPELELLAEAPTEAEPEAVAAAEPEPEPELLGEAPMEAALEPVAAAEPAPAPPPATPADAAPFPGFQPGRSLDDEIAAYELRIAALAAPLAPEPPIQAAAIHRPPPPSAMATPASARPPEMAAPSVVEQSVLAPMPGTCGSCGLSISASARFCRRCGARQGA